jgi:hypothetical protein
MIVKMTKMIAITPMNAAAERNAPVQIVAARSEAYKAGGLVSQAACYCLAS